VLGVTDDALARAEEAIAATRRVAPVVLTVLGVAAVAVATVLVLRARRRQADRSL
jgi:hypothetical protein